MTLQRFLAFLIFPFSIIGCILALIVSTILWVPYILCEAVDAILWKKFEIDTHLQGCLNWFYEAIGGCYYLAAIAIACVLSAFDNALY